MQQCDLCAGHFRTKVWTCASCTLTTCRDCSRRVAIEFAPSCAQCARPWTTEDLVRRLGKTFWSTTYRIHRRQHLARSFVPNASDHAVPLAPWWLGPHHHTPTTGIGARCHRCGHDLWDACPSTSTHVCDDDDVRAMQTIRSICRPCVRCGVPSMRTEGCPVMWCQHCHTFWNWDTGRLIETRRRQLPHNPDHRHWVMAARSSSGDLGLPPREVDDVPCGGLVDVPALHGAFVREFTRTPGAHSTVGAIMDATESVFRAQRLRIEHAILDHTSSPLDLSPQTLGHVLEKRERDNEFHRDVSQALETFVLSGTDTLQRFCAAEEDCGSTSRALEALRALVDARLGTVAAIYSRMTPRVAPLTFRWTVPYSRRQ